jgi:hypothetical protein
MSAKHNFPRIGLLRRREQAHVRKRHFGDNYFDVKEIDEL